MILIKKVCNLGLLTLMAAKYAGFNRKVLLMEKTTAALRKELYKKNNGEPKRDLGEHGEHSKGK